MIQRKKDEQGVAYQRILDRMIEGCQIISPDWRYLYLNDAAAGHACREKSDLLGRRMGEVFPGIEETGMFKKLAECMETRVPADMMNEFVYPDGSAAWFELRFQPVPEGVLVTSLDITRRKRSEDLLRIRLRLSELAQDGSLDELMQAALDDAETLTGSTIGFFHFVDADQETLTLQAWSTNTLRKMCTAKGKGRHYPMSQAGVWADCLRQRAPVIHNDYASLQDKNGLPAGHAPVVRELTVPVLRGNAVTAIIGVGNKPTDYTQNDVDTVQGLASLVMDLVERKRAEDALKEKEGHYMNLFDSTLDGVYRTDAKGVFTLANPAMARMLDCDSPEKLIGRRSQDFWIEPEEKDASVNELRNKKSVSAFPVRCRRENGAVTYVEISSHILEDENGNFKGIEGILRDVTARRNAEGEIKTQARQQEAVAEIGRLALIGGCLDDLLNEAVLKVADVLNVEYCKVLELIAGGKGLLLRSGVGWKEGLVGSAIIEADTNSQAGYTLLSKEPVVVEDLQKEVRFQGPPLLSDHSVVSGMSVIIGGLEHPYGVLGAHSSRRRTFSKDAIYFLQAVSNVLAEAIERKKSEEEKIQGKQDWEETFDSITDMVTVHDKDFNIIRANKAAEKALGLPFLEKTPGAKCFRHYHGSRKPPEGCPSCACLQSGESGLFEVFEPHLNMFIEIRAIPRFDSKNNLIGLIHIVRDVTDRKKAEEERKKLEEQLRQTQKIEAIGLLAGGVAHDFNNILSAIIGYAYLTLMKMQDVDPLRHNLEQILESTNRATVLTQSLLAFSRKQPVNLSVINLNEVIKGFSKFLLRLVREDVALKTACEEENLSVLADRGQIEQVIMNLVTNARDAMPNGGKLIIETKRVTLNRKFIELHGYGKEGEYALVSVSDTGIGMDEQTRSHIFEPFFTTKEQGKGTGLGLSMVYGTVKKHDGFINVYSEPGHGTTFKIYLPATGAAAKADHKMTEEPIKPRGGTETILIAEDDAPIRHLTQAALKQFGYTVIESIDGADAVAKFNENKEKIELVVLDGIMPRMNGKEAFREIKAESPSIKCIFMSGYSEDIFTKDGLPDGSEFILKPITPSDLLKRVREVLDK